MRSWWWSPLIWLVARVQHLGELWWGLSRFLVHFLVFLAFYHSKFTDVSKNWHTSSLYAFRKGERKNEVFPYRNSYVPGSDHHLHFSKNTLFASSHSCHLVYIYSGYMACIFLTFCTLVNFLREEEPWEGSEIENLLSWSVCLAPWYTEIPNFLNLRDLDSISRELKNQTTLQSGS